MGRRPEGQRRLAAPDSRARADLPTAILTAALGPPLVVDQGGIASWWRSSQGAAAMRLALYQPDQAGNVGTIIRLAACLGVAVDIIEPCGFPWGDKALKRAGMDYAEIANITRHPDWHAFLNSSPARLILLSSRANIRIDEARFQEDDIFLMGSESRGVPEEIHAQADMRIRIPQVPGARSLNIAVAAGIAVAEALRQTKKWP
jgi:tRNA (cytidine/uridine-2'-O-)-methyltransferase